MKNVAACAVFAGASALFCTQTPVAAQVLTVPAAVAQAQPQARLNGRSTLRFFGLEIDEARLWAAPDFALSRYAQLPFAWELEYRRSLSGKLIAERSLVAMRRQGEVRDAQFARLFFGIWLSPQTSEPQARCALAAC